VRGIDSAWHHALMAGIGISRTVWITALALSCAYRGLILPVWASPPSFKTAIGAASSHPTHLDLRPPSAHEVGDFPAASVDRPFWSRPRTAGSRELNLPALGADAGSARLMSGPETMVRRFRHEGLPVARLWENRSALVSLGLNAKGKPGLWLVQKTR
jgi:hypothetical protein